MKSLVASLGVTFLSFLSVSAQASSEFDKYDIDRDGLITLIESKINPYLMARFKDLDSDQDGRLTKSEFDNFKN
ncbi:EF-hand domain-containing protein [Pseudoalteromonas sp. L23]|uniref:EF-hand domain-containing protein n=1 Tax=unclassified Pseudoalteromonas TaxID=194690 RepID=UPI001EF0EC97|nr:MULTISPECIES: EF-hand domain-containing protein [unclassified Pseudoalteromonas]MCF7516507.1 EF-hand domain-containing protein [Pseudoalteromonas sp. L7]MCF7528551.1 EF-hand domain-containing protein [Pseudoalteromonas sp. L23]MCX2769699.1 EF-hand domain-containing protein [Pseudoalteromonas sp. B530]